MVGGSEHVAEHLEHAFFDFGAGLVVTPGVAHQRSRAVAVALREQSAREHVTALGGGRLLLGEEGTHRAIVDTIVPQARSPRGGGTAARAASSDWLRRRRRSAGRSGWCCRSAGSPIRRACARPDREMLASAALASASLPLRAASITRLTAAMSAAEVAAVGAIAKGPETGRASGLNVARLSNSAPCRPTLACAKAERPGCLRAGASAGAARSLVPVARRWRPVPAAACLRPGWPAADAARELFVRGAPLTLPAHKGRTWPPTPNKCPSGCD